MNNEFYTIEAIKKAILRGDIILRYSTTISSNSRNNDPECYLCKTGSSRNI